MKDGKYIDRNYIKRTTYCSRKCAGIAMRGKRKDNTFVEEKSFYKLFPEDSGEEILIDKDDLSRVQRFYWNIDSNGYVVASVNGNQQYLHRYILNVEKGDIIDHLNQNKLDNRKKNLRVVPHRVNLLNNAGTCVFEATGGWFVRVGQEYLGYYRDWNKANEIAQKKKKEYLNINLKGGE